MWWSAFGRYPVGGLKPIYGGAANVCSVTSEISGSNMYSGCGVVVDNGSLRSCLHGHASRVRAFFVTGTLKFAVCRMHFWRYRVSVGVGCPWQAHRNMWNLKRLLYGNFRVKVPPQQQKLEIVLVLIYTTGEKRGDARPWVPHTRSAHTQTTSHQALTRSVGGCVFQPAKVY